MGFEKRIPVGMLNIWQHYRLGFFLALLLHLLFSLPATSQTPTVSEPPPAADSPQVPFNNALQALAAGDTAAADRWLTITANDFPLRVDGLRALSLQISFRVAEELGRVRMAHHLLEGAKMELRDKPRWQSLMQQYERQALQSGAQLYDKAKLFLERDGAQDGYLPLRLDFGIDTQVAVIGKQRDAVPKGESLEEALGKWRSRLSKGELLEPEEMQRLERGEWLHNFLGFMGEMLAIPDDALLAGSYGGLLNRVAFYRAVGARLFIIWERNREARFAELARAYFERVLALTAEQPYQADRQKAKDFLAQMDARAGAEVPAARPAQKEKRRGVKP